MNRKHKDNKKLQFIKKNRHYMFATFYSKEVFPWVPQNVLRNNSETL